jgi:hypothetical protein
MPYPYEAAIYIVRVGEGCITGRVAAGHMKVAEGSVLIHKDAAGQVE